VDEHRLSEDNNSDVDTSDEPAAEYSNDEDTDADYEDDEDEFVDAGDEVEDSSEQTPWVTERRHSGDGEVTEPAFSIGQCVNCLSMRFCICSISAFHFIFDVIVNLVILMVFTQLKVLERCGKKDINGPGKS